MSKQTKSLACANPACTSLAVWSGRCNACHKHYRKHGTDRPITDQRPRQHTLRACANPHCGQQTVRQSEGLCLTCYNYKYHHGGADRIPGKRKEPGPKSPCGNCGEPSYLAERCTRCYHYRRRTGKERPSDLGKRKAIKCANPNCYRRITYRQRCDTCRKYFAEHGKDRSIELTRRVTHSNFGKDGKRLICRNCKLAPAKSNGRCTTCANYYRKHGHNRPRYMWDKNAVCLGGCGVLIRMQAEPRRGYCVKCYLKKREREKAQGNQP